MLNVMHIKRKRDNKRDRGRKQKQKKIQFSDKVRSSK